ncbi:uncharacterized protein LOC134240688 [Saccostrea cucullata]|uniref:uncharacterized protein LOC134240688 n=1 Tax=Saccostrea cuccullata TaxID=36930 RepID=UPI002ED295F1
MFMCIYFVKISSQSAKINMRQRRSSSGPKRRGNCSRSRSPRCRTTTPTSQSTTSTRQPRRSTRQSTPTRRTTLNQTVTSPETTAVISNNSARTPTAGNITRTTTTPTPTTSTTKDATTSWKTGNTVITTKSQLGWYNKILSTAPNTAHSQSPTTIPKAGEQEESTHLHVALIPTIIGLGIILTLLLCFVYKERLRNNIRNLVNKLRKNKTDATNFTTLNEEEGNSENPYDPSTYSVIENHVVVSPLPASRPSQQETVLQAENYSALDRRVEKSEMNKIHNNDYDLLNHPNQPPMNSSNVYSSTDPAFRSTEATLSNTYGFYQ